MVGLHFYNHLDLNVKLSLLGRQDSLIILVPYQLYQVWFAPCLV